MIYLSITQKSSQRAQQPFVKARRLSTRLEKAKRVVLVRSKYAPAEAEFGITQIQKERPSPSPGLGTVDFPRKLRTVHQGSVWAV
jgi:hypothetical protein